MDTTEQSFGKYIYDNGNKSLFEKLQSLSIDELSKYSPICLFGDIGNGKTCLLNAIKDKLKSEQPELKIITVNAESYVQEFVTSLTTNTIQDFKGRYRSLDALLFDDFDYLASKTSTQEELYYTLQALLEKKAVIVFTSTHSLRRNSFLQRLTSILQTGLNLKIPQPSEEIKIRKIRRFLQENNIALEESAITILASQTESMSELEGLLKKLKFLEQCTNQ